MVTAILAIGAAIGGSARETLTALAIVGVVASVPAGFIFLAGGQGRSPSTSGRLRVLYPYFREIVGL